MGGRYRGVWGWAAILARADGADMEFPPAEAAANGMVVEGAHQAVNETSTVRAPDRTITPTTGAPHRQI